MDNRGFISVLIDTFTPCIKDNETGELIDTEVIRIKRSSFLKKYNKANGCVHHHKTIGKLHQKSNIPV